MEVKESSLDHTRFDYIIIKALFVVMVLLRPCVSADSSDPARERLAIIVQCREVGKLDSDKLQSLVELEFLNNWKGELLERKDLDVLLKEMKLSVTLSESSVDVKLGEMLHVDYFVLVTIQNDMAVSVVNKFPEATVISEAVYRNQLNEESLARRIAVHSLKAMNEYELDKTKVHVSIGSFTYEDPFRQYSSVSDTIHNFLRERLAQHPKVTLTERYFPSHLLKEYDLTRSGFTKTVNANICAPPADIVIVGQFAPRDIQQLKSDDRMLDFTVTFLSPTDLFTKTVVSFSISSNNIQSAGMQIENALLRIVQKVEETLSHRTERRYNDAEFKTFKEQALKLIPSDRSTVQDSTPESPSPDDIRHEYERALRAIENSLLFKSDDTELMVQAGRLLGRMIDRKARVLYYKKDDPAYRDEYQRVKAISAASLDYIENAYLLNADKKTRNAYAFCGNTGYRKILSVRISRMLRHVVDSGAEGGWSDYNIRLAISSLIFGSDNIDEQTQTFLAFACNNQRGYKPLLSQIVKALSYIKQFIIKHRDAPEVTKKGIEFANRLVENESAAIKALGHYLQATIHCEINKDSEASLAEFSIVVDLIPDIYEAYGRDFYTSTFSLYVYEILGRYQFIEKENLTNNTYSVSLKYVTTQMQIKHYWDPGIKGCLKAILPELYKRGEYQKGYALVSEVLTHLKNDNDYVYGHIVRWKNEFQFKLSQKPRLRLWDLVNIDMSEARGQTRVGKLVYAFNKIWGVNCNIHIQAKFGQLFNLSADSTKAKFFSQIDGVISDIDYSSGYIGVATINCGVFFLDRDGRTAKNYTRQNSMLPTNNVRAICSDGETFYLGLRGKERGLFLDVHELNPEKDTINNSRQRISCHPARWFRGMIIKQDFRHRTRSDGDIGLEYTRRGSSSTVTDHQNNVLLRHEGSDLCCVYDLVLWHGILVFATENGLLVSEPESNIIRCVLNEVDLALYSLCAVDQHLFVGTNRGLFRIDYDTFNKLLRIGKDDP